MEDKNGLAPNSASENSTCDAPNAMDLDFIDELFLDGCWVETTDNFDFDFLLQSSPSLSLVAPNPILYEETQEKILLDNNEGSKKLWIPPNLSTNPFGSSSVTQRLMRAIGYLQECTKNSDFLIQIWVPVKKGGKQFLTTDDQPFTHDPKSKPLESYRNVSRKYHFPADEDSKESVGLGLPGRVFQRRVPEWTPDVRFFRSEEYPRIDYARQCDVRGSVAVPVFETGSSSCLGVVEMVTTSPKINYRPDLEIVCKALEAVDLRSSQNFSPSVLKVGNDSYQTALPRILEVLKSVSKIYQLPLSLTWAPCVVQDKEGCRHSNENYSLCVSTVDPACFVADPTKGGFLEACSEHHLLKGEGIVGKAFLSKKPCFSLGITAFVKSIYPLSHHARMFDLDCAIAIPLISIFTDSVDFVLEFFLPKDCKEPQHRDQVLNSLLGVVHQAFQSSQFVTGKLIGASLEKILVDEENKMGGSNRGEESSWVANMIESQRKGKGVSISLEAEKEPREEFKVISDGLWKVPEELERKGGGGNESVVSCGANSSTGRRKVRDRKRNKAEKSIGIDVLRQYFAGSLKDAAKSIGVCPTTLKRICRQHGINRWPSRKIKKVGHSLRKLQGVIDTVQGAQGSIQLDSFYQSFPELGPAASAGPSTLPATSARASQDDIPLRSSNQPRPQQENDFICSSLSPSSSCSRSSASIVNASSSGGTLPLEDTSEVLKRAHSDAELLKPTEPDPTLEPLLRSQSQKLFGEAIAAAPAETLLPPPPKGSGFRVKASYGADKVRFGLRSSWSFLDLHQEITKRFSINDAIGRIDLRYLDDDREWVLLTCDADLEECIDLSRVSENHTIQISVQHQASKLNLNSYGSSGGGQSQRDDRFL